MLLTVLLALVAAGQGQGLAADSYEAAVVEYAPPYMPQATADQVLWENTANYVSYIANASSISKVDIIVFPEDGLRGHGNQQMSVEVPSPFDNITPCDNSSFNRALGKLSCSARQYNVYVVVNLNEVYLNTATNKTELYNTNVAFNRNGTVIGRYRKYNPYGEPVNKPTTPDHHYFETDFGVRFGMFTCFDIDFEEPAVVLARKYGIKHFVFPHCWISELPFLTALQAQWGWAYSLDVVLLAAGCNDPLAGGSGSGIYHGRSGALESFQTNVVTSKLLIATVPMSTSSSNGQKTEAQTGLHYVDQTDRKSFLDQFDLTEFRFLDHPKTVGYGRANSSLAMLKDYLDVYSSHLLSPRDCQYNSCTYQRNSSAIIITQTQYTTLCQKTFCCKFQVQTTSTYSVTSPPETARGDDFTRYFYRLVAFDGVRWYGGGLATGGVQVCGVVSCVNDSIDSCGLRSDDISRRPQTFSDPTYGKYYKTSTVFESISVSAIFDNNDSFIYPDILVSGSGDGFGALVPSDQLTYNTVASLQALNCTLRTLKPIPKLVSAAIYARLFDRDGEKRTEIAHSFAHPHPKHFFIFCVLFLFIFHCIISKTF